MTSFKIDRWDSVIFGNGVFPYPMIYLKGDLKEIQSKCIQKNPNILTVRINNSGGASGFTSYDNRDIIGVLDTSKNFPNYRPNFYHENKYYVITLFTSWDGYPPENGNVVIK
jgi:hypothetical protein